MNVNWSAIQRAVAAFLYDSPFDCRGNDEGDSGLRVTLTLLSLPVRYPNEVTRLRIDSRAIENTRIRGEASPRRERIESRDRTQTNLKAILNVSIKVSFHGVHKGGRKGRFSRTIECPSSNGVRLWSIFRKHLGVKIRPLPVSTSSSGHLPVNYVSPPDKSKKRNPSGISLIATASNLIRAFRDRGLQLPNVCIGSNSIANRLYGSQYFGFFI